MDSASSANYMAPMTSLPTLPIEPVGAKGDTVLMFRETDSPVGASPRMFVAVDFDISPLGFQELMGTELHKPVTVRLNVSKARVVDTNIDGIALDNQVSFSTPVETPFLSQAIGLVKGGWLPSPLASTNANHLILLDRNVVSKIANLFENGERKAGAADFLDLYRDKKVRLSPMLFALESNIGAIPGPEVVRAQLSEAADKLAKALPHAEVISGGQVEQGILGLIEESRAVMGRQEKFLKALFPWLRSPVARRDVHRRWRETLEVADQLKLSPRSLVVLAALSTIAIPGRSIARGVFKFKQEFSSISTYNALADLRSLELLANYITHYPELQVQLCTADFAMAAFWVGIQTSGSWRDDVLPPWDMDPVPQLLPAEFKSLWRQAISTSGHATGLIPR